MSPLQSWGAWPGIRPEGGGEGGEKSFGHRYRRLYVYVVFPHSHLQHFNALVSALGTRPNICRDSAHLSWSSLCKHILEHFWWAKRLYTEGWVYGYKCSNTWLLFFCFDHFSVFFVFSHFYRIILAIHGTALISSLYSAV